MGVDKCKGLKKKEKDAWQKYSEAEDRYRALKNEEFELNRIAKENCDPENFEGKTGDVLKETIKKCTTATTRSAAKSLRRGDAEKAAANAHKAFTDAEKARQECEHKKSRRKK